MWRRRYRSSPRNDAGSMSGTSGYDRWIDIGVRILVVVPPFLLGAVLPWSAAFLEIIAFLLLAMTLLRRHDAHETSSAERVLGGCFSLLFAIVAIQLTPLPPQVVRVLSPVSYNIQREIIEGWMTISIAPYQTLEEMSRLAAYAAVFFVIVRHYRRREQLQGIVRTIIGTACVLVAFAIVQKLTWNGRLFWVVPLGPQAPSSPDVVWGPFINKNHFAGYLEMVGPLVAAVLLYKTAQVERRDEATVGATIIRYLRSRRLMPITALMILLTCFSTVLFATFSRGGVAAFGVSMLFFLITARMRRSMRKKTWALMLSAGVVLCAVVVAGWGRIEERFGSLSEELSFERNVTLERLDMWRDATDMLADFPLLGTGLGTFKSVYPRYQTTASTQYADHAHNDYLEMATDTGILGSAASLAVVLILAGAIARQWRRRKNAYAVCMGIGGLASFVAMAVHSAVDFNLHIPSNALLLAIIAGLTWAAVFDRDRRTTAALPGQGR